MRFVPYNFVMPITTPRLLIRPVQASDAALINAAVLESFETLRHFMDWAEHKPSLEESEKYTRAAAANWALKKSEEPWLQLCIFDRQNKQYIGASSFFNFEYDIPSMETGYWIRTSRAGQGLMTEAINAITQYAFKQLGIKRLVIKCDVDNRRSKKIPERLGYVLEATLKADRTKPLTGELGDTLVYARHDLNGLSDLLVRWGSEFE